MTSSNGDIFRVTGPLCGEFTGHRRIPRAKASDAGLWCFLLNGWVSNHEAGNLRRYHAHYDVIVMDNFCCKLAGKIAVSHWTRSFVQTETLKLLYQKRILPVLDYACSVWCHIYKSQVLINISVYKTMLLVLLLATLIIWIPTVLIYFVP